jgi:hypothetical protein
MSRQTRNGRTARRGTQAAPGRTSRARVARRATRRARYRVAAVGVVVALIAGGLTLVLPRGAAAGEITVYKTRSCGCCGKWIAHMRMAGFRVIEENRDDVGAVKRQQGVPSTMYSCHTSVAGGYVIEGHVPADLVERLLEERPDVVGLALPGMPAGAPGMEGAGKVPYEVLAFSRSGEPMTYAER